ncbi:unnamed protein product [Adineta ricciae]|uniref:Uncharacterized protein n=1 Tax=Adineta ricciae TaxID=249248 RepID=A0A814PZD6_ADIRI|nr:unnamed protein product [Adineta ricciae]
MAYSVNQTTDGKLPLVPNFEILMTYDGYRKFFGNCNDSSDIFSHQAALFNKCQANQWIDVLRSLNYYDWIKPLVEMRNKLSPRSEFTKDNCVTLMQFYSLLENVFRNTLLYPYISAYRIINKDCGRYRSFIEPHETKMPFQELQFNSTGPNLLTYTEINPQRTIIYALTCSIFYHHDLKKLQSHSAESTH